MATYKVIQDIEAEDKLVGPLTLRQFIYAAVAAVCLYICFLCYTKGAEFMIGIFFPIAAGAAFFAFPWKGEQPTEQWALARLRFMIKPRVRIWDQEGAKDLVTVTAPKKLKSMRPTRPALSQSEVRSRLKVLADTIDSRGWATRNAAYGMYNQSWVKPNLVAAASAPGMSAMIPDEDMFSENNTVSQNFDALLTKSEQSKRQRVLDRMANASAPQPQLAQLPNIPTPPISSAYSVAPAPAPMPIPAGQPMMPQGPAPSMPQPQANYWFANGPAYPSNPLQAGPMNMPMNPMMPMGQAPPAMPAMPMMPMPAPGPKLPPSMMAPSPMMPPVQGNVPKLPAVAIPAPAPAPKPMPKPEPVAISKPVSMPGPGPMPGMPGPGPMPMMMPPAPAATGTSDGSGPRIESDIPLAVSATPTDADNAAGQEIKQKNDMAMSINYGHMRVLQPAGQGGSDTGSQPSIDNYQAVPGDGSVAAGDQFVNGAVPEEAEPVTAPTNPAILDLANNDDLDIATLARQANRELNKAPDEVEIRLH